MPCKRKAAPAQGPRSPLSMPGEGSAPAPGAWGLYPRQPQTLQGRLLGHSCRAPTSPPLGPRLPPALWPARPHLQQAPQWSPSPASEVPGARRALSEAELPKVQSRSPCAGHPEGAQRGGWAQAGNSETHCSAPDLAGWSLPPRARRCEEGRTLADLGSSVFPRVSLSFPQPEPKAAPLSPGARGAPKHRRQPGPQGSSLGDALPPVHGPPHRKSPFFSGAILSVTESFLWGNVRVFVHVAPRRVTATVGVGVCVCVRGSVSMRPGSGPRGGAGPRRPPMSSPHPVHWALKRGKAPARTGPRGGRPPPRRRHSFPDTEPLSVSTPPLVRRAGPGAQEDKAEGRPVFRADLSHRGRAQEDAAHRFEYVHAGRSGAHLPGQGPIRLRKSRVCSLSTSRRCWRPLSVRRVVLFPCRGGAGADEQKPRCAGNTDPSLKPG